MNEPFPDPQLMSPLDRISAINTARSEQLEGLVHSEAKMRWLLSLLTLERQSATGRGSGARRSGDSNVRSAPVPLGLEDL